MIDAFFKFNSNNFIYFYQIDNLQNVRVKVPVVERVSMSNRFKLKVQFIRNRFCQHLYTIIEHFFVTT